MNDTYVYLTRLPDGIREMVVPCFSGFTIYINSDLTKEQQIESYEHALRHIKNGDHEHGGNVDEIEARTHRKE